MSLFSIWTKICCSILRKMFEYQSYLSRIFSRTLTGTFMITFILALKFKICHDVSSLPTFRNWSFVSNCILWSFWTQHVFGMTEFMPSIYFVNWPPTRLSSPRYENADKVRPLFMGIVLMNQSHIVDHNLWPKNKKSLRIIRIYWSSNQRVNYYFSLLFD